MSEIDQHGAVVAPRQPVLRADAVEERAITVPARGGFVWTRRLVRVPGVNANELHPLV